MEKFKAKKGSPIWAMRQLGRDWPDVIRALVRIEGRLDRIEERVKRTEARKAGAR